VGEGERFRRGEGVDVGLRGIKKKSETEGISFGPSKRPKLLAQLSSLE